MASIEAMVERHEEAIQGLKRGQEYALAQIVRVENELKAEISRMDEKAERRDAAINERLDRMESKVDATNQTIGKEIAKVRGSLPTWARYAIDFLIVAVGWAYAFGHGLSSLGG